MDQATFIFRTVVVTLAAILAAVVVVLLWGLYDSRVDNHEIFAIIGPAFHMIVGAFVGILSSKRWMSAGKASS